MKPSFYNARWAALEKTPSEEKLTHLSRQIALSFLDHYFYNDRYEEEYIETLCEMATCFKDEKLNKPASSALFGIVVEGLCDDFEDLQTETYNRVMSQVISFCRGVRSGKELDRRLSEFGLSSFTDIFGRIEKLRAGSVKSRKLPKHLEKTIFLSRVTIGADVAVTSVLLQRFSRRFPEAELVLIGSGRLSEIFSGNPSLRIVPVEYLRRGGLIERFASWHSVLEAVKDEAPNDSAEETILVDPDSRLSQLGVLPLFDNSRYFFFNSRGGREYPPKISLSHLVNLWADKVLGESEFCHPTLWLNGKNLERAAKFADALRQRDCRRIIAVNFGVGGNSRKRIDGGFEEKLVLRLLSEPGTAVILDKGMGSEEVRRAEAVMDAAKAAGHPVKEAAFVSLPSCDIGAGLVAAECGIGEVASLIANCDEFIGYDSACQHIAAALGIRTYTVFAGSNNPRFIRRWNACGPEKSEIIHVDTLSHPRPFDIEDVIERVIDARKD